MRALSKDLKTKFRVSVEEELGRGLPNEEIVHYMTAALKIALLNERNYDQNKECKPSAEDWAACVALAKEESVPLSYYSDEQKAEAKAERQKFWHEKVKQQS